MQRSFVVLLAIAVGVMAIAYQGVGRARNAVAASSARPPKPVRTVYALPDRPDAEEAAAAHLRSKGIRFDPAKTTLRVIPGGVVLDPVGSGR